VEVAKQKEKAQQELKERLQAREQESKERQQAQERQQVQERRVKAAEAQKHREAVRLVTEVEEQRLAHVAGQLERQRQLVWFPIPFTSLSCTAYDSLSSFAASRLPAIFRRLLHV
jgi:predicted trehalose synthase